MEQILVKKNRFFFWSVIIAILNPFFSGLILGIFMMSEPGLKKEGRIVTLFSLAWGIIALLLVSRFRGTLFF